jgi:hypothetical protein
VLGLAEGARDLALVVLGVLSRRRRDQAAAILARPALFTLRTHITSQQVSCVVCRVSCVVCRVSCVVCRVSCVVCRVSCVV